MSIPMESIRRCAKFTLDVSDDGWRVPPGRGRANIAAAREALAWCDAQQQPDMPAWAKPSPHGCLSVELDANGATVVVDATLIADEHVDGDDMTWEQWDRISDF